MASPIYSNNLRHVITGTAVAAKRALDVYIAGGTLSVAQGANIGASNVDAAVSASQTFTAPANAVGFILMNLDTSTQSIRWKCGGTASASSGSQLQAGRDTGYVPCGMDISICAESGTQDVNIQWVMSS